MLLVYNEPHLPNYIPESEILAYLPLDELKSPQVIALRASKLAQGLKAIVEFQYNNESSSKVTLVSFQLSYLPLEAWPWIKEFLKIGNHLISLRGIPFTKFFSESCFEETKDETWVKNSNIEYQYLEELGLNFVYKLDPHLLVNYNDPELKDRTFCIELNESLTFVDNFEWSQKAFLRFPVDEHEFFTFDPKLSDLNVNPSESGSSGTLDRIIHPLLHLTSEGSRNLSLPLCTLAFTIANNQGQFQGGKWTLLSWSPPTSVSETKEYKKTVKNIILGSILMPVFMKVSTSLACYYKGEKPSVLIHSRADRNINLELSIVKIDTRDQNEDKPMCQEAAEPIFLTSLNVQKGFNLSMEHVEYILPEIPTSQGLYKIRANYLVEGCQSLQFTQVTGFWIWDDQLVESRKHAQLISSGGEFKYIDQSKEVLIYGSTYMDSKYQRHYLDIPNPIRWNKDFSVMTCHQINLIRTGLWYNWKHINQSSGMINQSFLRSLDAFVLTCLNNNLLLIFTFFTFAPYSYGANNPYLDNRALQGQRDFFGILTKRYNKIGSMSWDLINEPTYGSPEYLFSQRPIPNGKLDHQAFIKWKKNQVKDDIRLLSKQWRTTYLDFSDVELPNDMDRVSDANNTSSINSYKAMDFTLFSAEQFYTWTLTMIKAIRQGNHVGLIGIGQDEPRIRLPSQFYPEELSYTSTHPWWNLDDLVWDIVMDQLPNKPHISQEIGIMLSRKSDRTPHRTPKSNAHLLERKLFTCLASGSKGFIQWLWHTNGYMTSDNENSIGLIRVDGGVKPEFLAMLQFGKLVKELQDITNYCQTDQRSINQVKVLKYMVIIPYSQWMLNPQLGVAPTQTIVKSLSYSPLLRTIPQMVNEYKLTSYLGILAPSVIFIPSIQTLTFASWLAVDVLLDKGSNLVVNGVIGLDPYHHPYPKPHRSSTLDQLLTVLSKLDRLNLKALIKSIPVEQYECASIYHYNQLLDKFLLDKETKMDVQFSNMTINYVHKHHNNVIIIKDKGKRGGIAWCGLPLELSTSVRCIQSNISIQTIDSYYQYAINNMNSYQSSGSILPPYFHTAEFLPEIEVIKPRGLDHFILVQQLKISNPDISAYVFVNQSAISFELQILGQLKKTQVLPHRAGAIVIGHASSTGSFSECYGGVSLI